MHLSDNDSDDAMNVDPKPALHDLAKVSSSDLASTSQSIPQVLRLSSHSEASNSSSSALKTGTAASTSRISTPHDTQLDRFAAVYVPQWLLDVNRQPPLHIYSPDTTHSQDLTAYAESIYPKKLIDDIYALEQREERDISDLLARENGQATRFAGVDRRQHAYARQFLPLQFLEHAARKEDLAKANLYNVRLEPFKDTQTLYLYKLQAPAIREGWPPLEPNDVVHLRQLRPGIHSWQGIEFVATVHATRRVQGFVILKCQALAQYTETMHFNITFRPQDRPFFAAHKGICYLDRQIPIVASDRYLSQAWLYPKPCHHEYQMPKNEAPPLPGHISWVDSNLNREQKIAVQAIVYRRRRVPFLIHGPPGTGKTKTVVEAVLQILKAYPDTHVLVCGASNPSADTLAIRLSANLSTKGMLRLSDESRPVDEVPATLLPWCNIVDDRFVLPALRTLLDYQVIVTSVLDASVLVNARVTNTCLARLEETVYKQLLPQKYDPSKFHFDYLLVDEAAQASEPELSPALAVVLPETNLASSKNDHGKRRVPQLVLCGDHMQLGPQISSEAARQAELDLSLMQRLFERPFYKDHPKARRHLPPARKGLLHLECANEAIERPPDGWAADPADLDVPFATLLKNYRSSPGLLMVPSALFYNDTLEPTCATAIRNSPLQRWHKLKNAQVPLLVWHTEGQEEMFQEGVSWYNDLEVDRVVQTVQNLVNQKAAPHGFVHPAETTIISPFREQVWSIRLALRKVGLHEVNVGRETDVQGAENRIVIISSVRSSSRFLADDRARGRGLLYESKRFNVATTRAKELMIVVGHVPTLYADPYWQAMINFAIRRDAYDGPPLGEMGLEPPDNIAHGLSKLEETLMMDSGTSEHALASSVARIALHEG